MIEAFTDTSDVVSLFCAAKSTEAAIDEQDLAASEPKSQKDELAGTQPLAVLVRAEAHAPRSFRIPEGLSDDDEEQDEEKGTEGNDAEDQKLGQGHNKDDAMIAMEVDEKESLTEKMKTVIAMEVDEMEGVLADDVAGKENDDAMKKGGAIEMPAKKQRLAEQTDREISGSRTDHVADNKIDAMKKGIKIVSIKRKAWKGDTGGATERPAKKRRLEEQTQTLDHFWLKVKDK